MDDRPTEQMNERRTDDGRNEGRKEWMNGLLDGRMENGRMKKKKKRFLTRLRISSAILISFSETAMASCAAPWTPAASMRASVMSAMTSETR